jgi:hypothetical protein
MPTAQVYRAYCLACHDADGSGQVARKAMPDLPDFTDPKWQAAHAEAALQQSILEGKGKFMLPMRDKLSAADAGPMVAYVRAFANGKHVSPTEPQQPLVPALPDPARGRRPQGARGGASPTGAPSGTGATHADRNRPLPPVLPDLS